MQENTPLYDESVRSGLEAYIADNELTHADVARQLGFSATRITKYLNLDKPDNKPETDARKVEAAARAHLRHAARLAEFKGKLFDNGVARDCEKVFKQVRRTGDVGLLYGPAGIGKTCACHLFCRDNPNTLFITAKQYASGAGAVSNMLFEELTNSTEVQYPGNVPRMSWAEQVLRGTERLIIVDNAQRLHISAFEMLMDFHDATLGAIALVGNPDALNVIRQSDQLFSRIGICPPLKSQDQKDAEASALKLIEQFAPGAEKELLDEAVDVIGKLGASRTLKKRLILSANIREGGKASWMDAFKQAGELLVKPAVAPRRKK